MKTSYLILLSVMSVSSCDFFKKDDSSDAAFLSGGAKTKVVSEFADSSPTGKPADTVPNDVVQNIKILSSDWDKMTIRIKQCESEKKLEAARTASELEAASAKGRIQCLASLDKLVNDKATDSLKETVQMVEDFKNALLKYKHEFAIVNGDCVGKMSDGHLRSIRVKGDACLSVPFFKIGTGDGEIKGIEEAVSADAMTNGILSLSCDDGRAHIRPTSTPCSSAPGSATKTTFEKM